MSKPLAESPSQTAGPYVHIGCMPAHSGIEGLYSEDPGSRMLDSATPGERIYLRGIIFDGDDAPLTDAVIEIWQANAAGVYATPANPQHDGFSGWGRTASDAVSGEFCFETIKPGAVPYPDGRPQAPHITLWIVARGINLGLQTRLYFDDEAEANAADPLLSLIEPRDRVATLVATTQGEAEYRLDIRLQGPRETVFLDI